jgi:hypothetical protein
LIHGGQGFTDRTAQEIGMASTMIRNLDDEVKRRRPMRAASNGGPWSKEARQIHRAVFGDADPLGHTWWGQYGRVLRLLMGSILNVPSHEPMRPSPVFNFG